MSMSICEYRLSGIGKLLTSVRYLPYCIYPNLVVQVGFQISFLYFEHVSDGFLNYNTSYIYILELIKNVH